MSEICGMIPFINSSHPDQFYRLFISLFIHVGSVVLCAFMFALYFAQHLSVENINVTDG